eukprot:gene1601-1164_t
MLRLASLAAKLKQPTTKVQSDILVKANGRLFMKWGEEYFAYKAAKDVIVPFELAEDYARLKCKLSLPPPASVRDATVNAFTADQDEKKRMVLALLGHFNHGKTSLLDALINHSRSSSSVVLTTSSAAQATGLPNGVAAVGGKVVGDVVSDLVSEEKYGITQEVRSRHVSITPQYELTLIDTPGQEIFYRMRNSGSEVSDGSLLLIAVNDDIQLQTKESIGLVESSTGINLEALLVEIQKLFDRRYGVSAAVASGRRGRARIPRVTRQAAGEGEGASPSSVATDAATPITEDLKLLPADEFTSLTGRGVVLNLIYEVGTSPSLHVLLREGTIRVGDYLQSGGWMGRVRGLFVEDLNKKHELSTLSQGSDGHKSKKHNNKNAQMKKTTTATQSTQVQCTPVDVAYPGMAVRILPKYLEDCVDPRPVGEPIHFFSPAVLEEQRKSEKQREGKPPVVSPSELKRIDTRAKEEALWARDEQIMEDEIDIFRMSEEQVQRFRLMRLFAVSRLPKHHFYVRADRAAPVWVDPHPRDDDENENRSKNSEEDDDATDTSDDEEEEEWEGEDTTAVTQAEMVHDSIASSSSSTEAAGAEKTLVYAKRPKLVIVRMRSDLDMGTFLDRYHDFHDHCIEHQMPATVRVLQSGIGTISKSDIQVAIAAGKDALVVGYGVEVEVFAMKDAQENQVKLLLHDNMPELLYQIFGSYGSVVDDSDTTTGDAKKKKKKKKKKTKNTAASAAAAGSPLSTPSSPSA